ncbi:hypothetical protein PV735_37740 [Streptomyces turgidiscabies]|uniref:Core-binding (CB) domain-containing protein n=1 Tax=Streptomyces turgidiscabies (strain Car8) TaxID=698760 RepID=L7F2J3_STRT8|nr:hypothetical protein [Streptomyces turgidiscabies]ELP65848.1 hypothetical protein STRTUCAR8_01989 [Streptomyces turgidiscabies Car8]MDX3498389.1 hypothetical protein [Streptomyces turgidiscabies]GAQ74537.1 hypothetical protein T45_06312 [Streptomyces turgidiscabies]
MSPRGRKAVLPPADFQATPHTDPTGLRVTVVNNRGLDRLFDFTDLEVPAPMRQALAAAFVRQSVGWNSHATAHNYWRVLTAFAAFLKAQGHPAQDLDKLSTATVKLLRTNFLQASGTRRQLASLQRLLRQDPRLAGSPVAEELARPVRRLPSTRQSLEEDEYGQVKRVAMAEFRAALLRIRENTAHLERYRSGELAEGSRDWKIGRILEHVAATGDVPRTASSKAPVVTNARLLGGHHPLRTWGRLFLTPSEVTALAVLMTAQWGWNLSMYHRVPVPVRTPSAGETSTITYQVQVEKHRACEGRWWDTENITDSGAGSDGRLITQALEATAHGRALVARLSPGTDLLMAYRTHRVGRGHNDHDRPQPVGPIGFGLSRNHVNDWRERHALARSPFQPLRRTVVVEEGQPLQHKQGTHESVYVLPDLRVQKRSRAVIAAGAMEAHEQARDLTFQGRLADAPDPAHQETAAADCTDEQASRWPAPGGGCGADFLACLACENARVHTGHHPRLAVLHQDLHSLRGTLPGRHWAATWDTFMHRLEDLRERVGESAFDHAGQQATERDHMIVKLLVKGDLVR